MQCLAGTPHPGRIATSSARDSDSIDPQRPYNGERAQPAQCSAGRCRPLPVSTETPSWAAADFCIRPAAGGEGLVARGAATFRAAVAGVEELSHARSQHSVAKPPPRARSRQWRTVHSRGPGLCGLLQYPASTRAGRGRQARRLSAHRAANTKTSRLAQRIFCAVSGDPGPARGRIEEAGTRANR